eukprot:4114285-Pyramimonas_sp.AAC.1
MLVYAARQVLLDLATNLDVNAKDKDNNTPLLVAVQNLQTKARLAHATRTIVPPFSQRALRASFAT